VNLRSLSTLQIALLASIAVHAVLLTVRFVDPESFNRVFKDTPLEVVLVNSRSQDKPNKAQVIAQNSLAGGGDADTGRATSPLPPSAFNLTGNAVEQEAAQQLQSLQEQQNLLLTQLKNQLALKPPPESQPTATKAQRAEREQKRRQMAHLIAEIERRIQQENARPRKRYISPAATGEVYALYYDALRRAIEERGTENFPQAGGKKLYGELTMVITVNHTGRVLSTEVAQSSGNPALDRRAAAIARAAGPFGHFTPAMRRQADQLVVVSRFRFTRDETLEANLSALP
jgi:protein TonB